MPDKSATEYVEAWKNLQEDRKEAFAVAEELRDYLMPSRGVFDIEKSDRPSIGEKRHDFVLDGTAERAIRILIAGMQGGLTSPARPWFRLELEERYAKLLDHPSVKQWLHFTEQAMYRIYAKSNFYNIIHNVYAEESVFGQAVCLQEEDDDTLVRFRLFTAGEYALAENDKSIVDTVYRIVWMTAKQMEDKFGYEKLPQDVKNQLRDTSRPKGNRFQWFKVLHCIRPRKNYNPRKTDSKNMPIESVYIDESTEEFIHRTGYNETSIAVPRWDASGPGPYGRGPGHTVLGDVKGLQAIQKSRLKALHKVTDPPMKTSGGLKGSLRNLPGSVTHTQDPTAAEALTPLYQIRPDIPAINEAIVDLRLQIREGFYNDLFLMLVEPRPNMTATEVVERHEEKLLMLGPVIERQFTELLNPIIDRTYAIMTRSGVIPPPPEELIDAMEATQKDIDIKVKYVSLLAQAQKLVTTQAINSFTGFGIALSERKPEVLDKINFDEAIDEFGDAVGIPPTVIVPDGIVTNIREERLRQQQAQEQAQQISQAAQVGKTLSETSLEADSALSDLRRGMEGTA